MRDLNAGLTQLRIRLDQIEHEYRARLDKLSERVDQDSSSRFADIAARLDKLEKKSRLAGDACLRVCRCRGEAR